MPRTNRHLARLAPLALLLGGCYTTDVDITTQVEGPFATSGFEVEIEVEIPDNMHLSPAATSSIEPTSAELGVLRSDEDAWSPMSSPGASSYQTIRAAEPGMHTYQLALDWIGQKVVSFDLEFATPTALSLDVTGLVPGVDQMAAGELHYLVESGFLLRVYSIVDDQGRSLGGSADLEVLENPSTTSNSQLWIDERQFGPPGSPDSTAALRVRTPAGDELAGPMLVARNLDEVSEDWTLDVRVEDGLYWVDLIDPEGERVVVGTAVGSLRSEDPGLRRIDTDEVSNIDCGYRLSDPDVGELHEVEYCVGSLCGVFELPGVVVSSSEECFLGDDRAGGCVEIAASGSPRGVSWLLLFSSTALLCSPRRRRP